MWMIIQWLSVDPRKWEWDYWGGVENKTWKQGENKQFVHAIIKNLLLHCYILIKSSMWFIFRSTLHTSNITKCYLYTFTIIFQHLYLLQKKAFLWRDLICIMPSCSPNIYVCNALHPSCMKMSPKWRETFSHASFWVMKVSLTGQCNFILVLWLEYTLGLWSRGWIWLAMLDFHPQQADGGSWRTNSKTAFYFPGVGVRPLFPLSVHLFNSSPTIKQPSLLYQHTHRGRHLHMHLIPCLSSHSSFGWETCDNVSSAK